MSLLPTPGVKILTHMERLNRYTYRKCQVKSWYWCYLNKKWLPRFNEHPMGGEANWVYCRELFWWELEPQTAFEAGYTHTDRNSLLTLTDGYRWLKPGEIKIASDECFREPSGDSEIPAWTLATHPGKPVKDYGFPFRRAIGMIC